MTTTEPTASTTPKPSASPGSMRPAGKGRCAVRRITASMSRSYHMLIAPEAPAPTAVIGADPVCECEGVENDEDEAQRRGVRNERADRRHHVPAGKRIGVVRDAPRHAGEPEEVLREEGQVDADERRPEMDLAE